MHSDKRWTLSDCHDLLHSVIVMGFNESHIKGGFTLLELVIVIAILGIISIAVVARYKDLKKEAATASADSVFQTAQTAVARHFSKKLMGAASDNVTTCQDLVSAMSEDPTRSGWTCNGIELKATIGGHEFIIKIAQPESAISRAVICCSWESANCPKCSG